MNLIEEKESLRNKLNDLLMNNDMSIPQIAKEIGIAPYTLRSFIINSINAQYKTYLKIKEWTHYVQSL